MVKIPLKYKFSDLFKGKFPIQKKLFEVLEDLQKQIDDKSNAKAIVKKDVKLNKTQLKKAFGDPKNFDYVGVVINAEGSYLIVSDGVKFNFATLDEV